MNKLIDLLGKKIITVIGSGCSAEWGMQILHSMNLNVKCSSQSVIPSAFKNYLEEGKIPYEEGRHSSEFIQDSDVLLVSPGVKPSHSLFELAHRKRIHILTEVDIAALCQNASWVGITGSNGKTTTASLLHSMISKEHDCDLCGNIGYSFSQSLMEHGPNRIRVVELSSFQLKFSNYLKPNCRVLLNLNPNHLDWHDDLGDYYDSKYNLFKNREPKDHIILNYGDENIRQRLDQIKGEKVFFSQSNLSNGFYLKGDFIFHAKEKCHEPLVSVSECQLRGSHSRDNVLAAVSAAFLMGISKKNIQRALDQAKPLAHRLETLGRAHGITFVNDSKSTTEDSTIAALESFAQKVILIVGGQLKVSSFNKIARVAPQFIQYLVMYGEAGEYLNSTVFNEFDNKVVVREFRDAVIRAYENAQHGDVILLSPMCSSFDQFSSFEERGEKFKVIFEELNKQRFEGRHHAAIRV